MKNSEMTSLILVDINLKSGNESRVTEANERGFQMSAFCLQFKDI